MYYGIAVIANVGYGMLFLFRVSFNMKLFIYDISMIMVICAVVQ